MKMRHLLLFLLVFMLTIFTWYLVDRFSYSNKFEYYDITEMKSDTTLTIGIIGDSWVARNKLDTLLVHNMKKHGYPCNVISSGHPGAKTKRIYQNLFENGETEYSSKYIIERQPEYCIIIAGVNDAASQIGSNYYTYHTLQIIKTLLHYGIKPVVVSLPEFGVEESVDKMNIISKNRNLISAYFNNNGEIDNIQIYRDTFNKKLKSEKLEDKVIMVDFDDVCKNYENDSYLYANSAHLSVEGNKMLSEKIVNSIISYDLK